MGRFLGILIILIQLIPSAVGQDIFLNGRDMANDRQKTYVRTKVFVESKGYNQTDFIYQRMEWVIDPAVRYISGNITTHFKYESALLDVIQIDLHQNLQVDSIIYNDQKIDFSLIVK